MEGSEVLIVAAEAWIRVWHCCLGPLFACGFRVDFRKDSRKTSEWTLNRMLKWIAVVLQRAWNRTIYGFYGSGWLMDSSDSKCS